MTRGAESPQVPGQVRGGGGDRAARREEVPRPDPSLSVPEGLVVVDKPQDWTSHDVVARLRRLCGTRRVGHAGTLDPMATGVLILGVGRGTKLLTHLVGADKTYEATVRLGVRTLSDDAEGEATATADEASVQAVTEQRIREAVQRLTGEIQQVPSAVSAIKVDGKRSYARVRAGEDVELAARPVTVSRFEIHGIRRHEAVIDLEITVEVSSGTYIRALARDLGEALSIGGHLTRLRRTRVGAIGLESARELTELSRIVAGGGSVPCTGLDDAVRAMFPVRALTEQQSLEIGQGKRIAASGTAEPQTLIAGFDPQGHVVALLEDRGHPGQRTARSALVFQGRS